jgi:histidinol dehydrogenase
LAGVDRVFQVGGAQAIAALAYGTESIPKVDMVCGPGNLFVTIAKQMVYGQVGVDGLYGPTETVVIADSTSDPVLCAADLLAQAEHDALASPILLTVSESLVMRVEQELDRQITHLRRREIASQSLEANGLAVLVGDMEEAVELANHYAPEHLCLLVAEPWKYLSKIRNAGAVFVGQDSPEVLGDYTAGPSHVMPTAGTARFSSPLGVHQFLKVTSVVGVDLETLTELAGPTIQLAQAEEFDAHARAVQLRLEKRGRRRETN